jgi:hypothetical protein
MALPQPSQDPRLRWPLLQPYSGAVGFACAEFGEDHALVLAIWARETTFGTCGPSFVVAPGQPIWMGRGDGGHGRGFPQIDDRGPWKHLIPPDGADWPVLDQARASCTVLAGARAELAAFRGAISERAWEEAVACRYNAALANVQWAIRNGRDPNLATTPGPYAAVDPATGKRLGDYGRDVLAMRDGLRALYPSTFPLPVRPAGGIA